MKKGKKKKVKTISQNKAFQKNWELLQAYFDKIAAIYKECNLPQEVITRLNECGADLQREVEALDVETQDAEILNRLKKDDELATEIIKNLDEFATKEHYQEIIDFVEYPIGHRVVKCDSLAEQIKVEAFIEQLTANPYQLDLLKQTA